MEWNGKEDVEMWPKGCYVHLRAYWNGHGVGKARKGASPVCRKMTKTAAGPEWEAYVEAGNTNDCSNRLPPLTRMECESAATGMDADWDREEAHSEWPRGCYVYKLVYFNNHPTGAAQPEARPICKTKLAGEYNVGDIVYSRVNRSECDGTDPLGMGDQGTVEAPDANDSTRLQIRFELPVCHTSATGSMMQSKYEACLALSDKGKSACEGTQKGKHNHNECVYVPGPGRWNLLPVEVSRDEPKVYKIGDIVEAKSEVSGNWYKAKILQNPRADGKWQIEADSNKVTYWKAPTSLQPLQIFPATSPTCQPSQSGPLPVQKPYKWESYVELPNTNTCVTETPIPGRGECEKAAEEYNALWNGRERVDNWPKGCYTYRRMYWNKHMAGKPRRGASPVCRRMTDKWKKLNDDGNRVTTAPEWETYVEEDNKNHCNDDHQSFNWDVPRLNMEECEATATAFHAEWDREEESSDWPTGCYVYKLVYWNDDSKGAPRPEAAPICRRIMGQDP